MYHFKKGDCVKNSIGQLRIVKKVVDQGEKCVITCYNPKQNRIYDQLGHTSCTLVRKAGEFYPGDQVRYFTFLGAYSDNTEIFTVARVDGENLQFTNKKGWMLASQCALVVEPKAQLIKPYEPKREIRSRSLLMLCIILIMMMMIVWYQQHVEDKQEPLVKFRKMGTMLSEPPVVMVALLTNHISP